MPLRALFRYLVNNEKLVERIAESYPVRRAAQLAVSLMYKGKHKLSDVDPKQLNGISLSSFVKRFSQYVKEGMDDAKKQLKK